MSHVRNLLGTAPATALLVVIFFSRSVLSLQPISPEIAQTFVLHGGDAHNLLSKYAIGELFLVSNATSSSGLQTTGAAGGAAHTATTGNKRSAFNVLHGHGAALRHSFVLAARRHSRQHHRPSDPKTVSIFVSEEKPRGTFDFCLACGFLGFALLSLKDLHTFTSMWASQTLGEDDPKSGQARLAAEAPNTEKDRCDHNWSVAGLVALTAYRFYTGFLSATWLPYLLAMEGDDLWSENQSLFMGVAKLIYGITILINPIMGRIGDRAVIVSHGLGRRLFVRFGVTISAVGIFICLGAARYHHLYSFLFGILTWRLGEAINDVTTEAIIPEMVPPEQFQLAGSIKAANFLLGGLFGYVLLIEFVYLHYSWLYYAYLLGMFSCAIPALLILNKDEFPIGLPRSTPNEESLGESMLQAYFVPTQCDGGFPRFCLATFVFTLGTSPMFFLLLMVRDLLGVSDPIHLQKMFSWTSIVFFVSAAVSSILSGIGAPKIGRSGTGDGESPMASDQLSDQALKEVTEHRWWLLVWTQIAFGIIICCMPAVVLFRSLEARVIGFLFFAVIFGACFGSGYSRFQEATWQVLPAGERGRANAMGFNTMCRLLGVGIGNFVAGLLLDFFYTGIAMPDLSDNPSSSFTDVISDWFSSDSDQQVYKTKGYVIMCTACCICNVISAYITSTIEVCRKAG